MSNLRSSLSDIYTSNRSCNYLNFRQHSHLTSQYLTDNTSMVLYTLNLDYIPELEHDLISTTNITYSRNLYMTISKEHRYSYILECILLRPNIQVRIVHSFSLQVHLNVCLSLLRFNLLRPNIQVRYQQ